MKFLYLNIPAHGHVNPTLPLVKELTDKGNEVIYFNLPEFKDKISKSGAQFREYPFPEIFKPLNAENPFELSYYLWKVTEKIIPFLILEMKKNDFDGILHDSLCIWGRILVLKSNIKSVCTVTTFAMNARIIRKLTNYPLSILKSAWKGREFIYPLLQIRNKISREIGVQPGSLLNDISNNGGLNIVFTSEEFQPESNTLESNFHFAGPSIGKGNSTDSEIFKLPPNEIIYISLGTLRNDRADFFSQCIHELRDIHAPVLISVGNRIQLESLPSVPDHFMIRKFMPQIEILQKARLFLTHGGMNSVNEGLYFGVPMLVFPQTEEQSMVARRVEQIGAGIILKERDLKKRGILRKKIDYILTNEKYQEIAHIYSQKMQNCGGPLEAARKVLEFFRC